MGSLVEGVLSKTLYRLGKRECDFSTKFESNCSAHQKLPGQSLNGWKSSRKTHLHHGFTDEHRTTRRTPVLASKVLKGEQDKQILVLKKEGLICSHVGRRRISKGHVGLAVPGKSIGETAFNMNNADPRVNKTVRDAYKKKGGGHDQRKEDLHNTASSIRGELEKG